MSLARALGRIRWQDQEAKTEVYSFKRLVARARLPSDITFHCLRDTFVSRLATRVSAPTLMTLARHRNFSTTQRYLKVSDRHLRDAVEGLIGESTVTITGTGFLYDAQIVDE